MPPANDIPQLFKDSEDAQVFIQNLAIFMTGFFKVSAVLQILAARGVAACACVKQWCMVDMYTQRLAFHQRGCFQFVVLCIWVGVGACFREGWGCGLPA